MNIGVRMVATVIVVLAAAFAAPLVAQSDSDVLARTRAAYKALKAYSDTGTVDVEFGPAAAPLRERHTFRTLYRAPRHFYFEFNEDQRAGGERFVVWSDADAFHTWWSTTGLENSYPKGQGAAAFALGAVPTKNALLQMAPLLFQEAGLTGTLTEFTEAAVAGTEDGGGRASQKLTGIARSVYPATGHVTNVRQTTVWIDAATGLVRKVFEDTPRGTPAGTVGRTTTTFEPVANPALDDTRFRFTAPSSSR
jgi:outer membrane lipoprotein-sorting protein